jgi:hypothetical protein
MAKDKKSVIVYVDWIATFNKLEDDEAGRLIKHFFSYINDLNPTSDRLTELLFEPMKQQLKRDLKSYEQTCERNSLNASLRWNKNNATACDRMQSNAKHADNDNDNDNENEKDNEKHTNTIFSFDEFWETYNKKTGKANCERIYARLKDKDYAKIKETLPIYLDSVKDKQFLKNPQTYLNGRIWEDEIYQPQTQKKQEPQEPIYSGYIDLSKLKPLR